MKKTIDLCHLKKVQLEVMDFFHSWCKENQITYFITAGTLIGALRHKGFIPWDDDIDVVMLRKEYDRMIELFPRTGRYRLFSEEVDSGCIYPYAKIYDSNTVMLEGNELDHPTIGVNIDIFPLENATDNYQDAIRLKESIKVLDSILAVKLLDKVDRGFIKNVTVSLLRLFAKFFSYPFLVRQIIRRAKRYIANVNSHYVVNAVIYAKGEREILEREWFKETVELDFEGRKYLAPVGADQYMRRLFGDYMQLPPEDKRISHHRFKAYYK